MKKGILFLILIASVAINILAQPVHHRLDSLYTSLANQGYLNGNVLVSEKGRLLYQQSFGYADVENKKTNRAETAFQLASLSKPFTAIAILQLADKGLLNLNEPLSRYIPEFPYSTLTISQLLSHSSGLSDQELAKPLAAFEIRLGHRHNNAELVQFLAQSPVKLSVLPGQKWWYSNLGYELLAYLVEKRSGQRFEDYSQKNIILPCGMTHTYLLTSPTDQQPYQARNYDFPNRYAPQRQRIDQQGADYTEKAYGHSNMVSTCGDLLRLTEAFFTGKLVSPSLVKRALEATRLANGQPNTVWLNIGGMGATVDGLGWFIFTGSQMNGAVFHAGGMPGAVTILLHHIEKQQTVILLDNMGSEGIYKNAQNGLRILNNLPVLPAKHNLARLYGRQLMKKGADEAAGLILTLRSDTARYALTEHELNNLGYALLGDKLVSQALEVFKLTCLLYPASDNVFNSYAEALEQNGQPELARKLYEKSVALNPDNAESKQALNRLKGQPKNSKAGIPTPKNK